MMMKPPIWAFLIPAGMSLIAVFEMPYGYYQLLRIIVALACVWIATYYWSLSMQVLAVIFGFTAIIFNPIFKIQMEREAHLWFNLATVLLLLFAMFFNKRREAKLP